MKKELSFNSRKKKGHLAHMCNSKGDKGDKGDKAIAEQSTSTGGAPKKVEFARGTKKESALKFATVMSYDC